MKETKELIAFMPESVQQQWNGIEVKPVRFVNGEFPEVCETCEEDVADMYSLYVRTSDGEAICVADLPTKEWADQLASLIKQMVKMRPRKENHVFILCGIEAVQAYQNDNKSQKDADLSEDTLSRIKKEAYYLGKIRVGSHKSIESELNESFEWAQSVLISNRHYEQIVNFKP